jgi:hypothetical protein
MRKRCVVDIDLVCPKCQGDSIIKSAGGITCACGYKYGARNMNELIVRCGKIIGILEMRPVKILPKGKDSAFMERRLCRYCGAVNEGTADFCSECFDMFCM